MAAAAEEATLLWCPRAVLVLVKLVFTPKAPSQVRKAKLCPLCSFGNLYGNYYSIQQG